VETDRTATQKINIGDDES